MITDADVRVRDGYVGRVVGVDTVGVACVEGGHNLHSPDGEVRRGIKIDVEHGGVHDADLVEGEPVGLAHIHEAGVVLVQALDIGIDSDLPPALGAELAIEQ